jgi:diguanylate cyclase
LTDSYPIGPAASLIPRILHLLADLRQTPTGDAICRHIQDILEAYESEVAETRGTSLTLLRSLLDAWSKRVEAGSPEALEIRMLQLRLTQTPRRSELDSLQRHIQALAGEERGRLPEAAAALQPAAPAQPPPTPPPPVESLAAGSATARPLTMPAAATPAEPAEPGHDHGAVLDENGYDQRVDHTYRKHLQEKRERIQQIQDTLVQQVNEVIKQNEKFGVLLEVEHETLRRTDNVDELEGLKRTLVNEVGKLREGHHALAHKLESASKYLQLIESEGQDLNEELTRVHILSLTDELTDLPNRRAFLRRLEDEVARVQRYGYPLSLALIDMDGFKAINDRYGHAAGDEVLRNFASNVLSIFRHHDMVARYGGEEFAVLLPNTDKTGALRALEKVGKRNAEGVFPVEDRTLPMPTFSAGISLYKPGETPSSLIERADKALYQAKRLGRNRVELAQHEAAETAPR